nr:hypothetical protein [Bacillota bacterium]
MFFKMEAKEGQRHGSKSGSWLGPTGNDRTPVHAQAHHFVCDHDGHHHRGLFDGRQQHAVAGGHDRRFGDYGFNPGNSAIGRLHAPGSKRPSVSGYLYRQRHFLGDHLCPGDNDMAMTSTVAAAADWRLLAVQQWCGGIPMTAEMLAGIGLWKAWSIPWLLVILAVLAWYIMAARGDFQPSPQGARKKAPFGKIASFTLGVILFYLAVGSPLHIIGHFFMFSIHMLTMAVLYFIVPPLILYGLTEEMYASLLRREPVRKLYEFFSQHTALSLVTFNLMLSVYHIPPIFDLLKSNSWAGTLIHGLLFLAAMLNWLPVSPAGPMAKHHSEGKKIVYLFVDALALTPACVFVIFSDRAMYEAYRNAPQLVSWLTALTDQQLGGIIMLLTQHLVYMVVLVILVFQWFYRDQQISPEPNNLVMFSNVKGQARRQMR